MSDKTDIQWVDSAIKPTIGDGKNGHAPTLDVLTNFLGRTKAAAELSALNGLSRPESVRKQRSQRRARLR